MAVDAGIYGQIRPYAPENPLNALTRVLQVKGLQDETAMRGMQMEQMRRQQDEQNRLQALLANLPEGEAGVAALTRGGFLQPARQLAESQVKIAKDKREAQKFDLEAAHKKIELIGQLAGSANDQATWERALQIASANGIDISQEPRQFDPNRVAQMRQMALTAAQQIEAQRKAASAAEESANRPVVIGPDGQPRVNPVAVEAKSRIAAAGAARTSINLPGQEKEEQKAVGKYFGEQYADLQKAAIAATQKLSRLDRLEQLLAGIETGKTKPAIAQVQAIAKDFGVNLGNVDALQGAQALMNEMALQMRNPAGGAGMPGALSDKDREFLTQTIPNIANTPGGNKLIIETQKRLAKRDREVAKLATEYRRLNGTLDDGFLVELERFSAANPLFGDMQSGGQTGAQTDWSSPAGGVLRYNPATGRLE